jgi:hypothetical protein
MRVRIRPPVLPTELEESLIRGDCIVSSLGDGTFDVVHQHAANEREAQVELQFFLRAWVRRHPEVQAELLG